MIMLPLKEGGEKSGALTTASGAARKTRAHDDAWIARSRGNAACCSSDENDGMSKRAEGHSAMSERSTRRASRDTLRQTCVPIQSGQKDPMPAAADSKDRGNGQSRFARATASGYRENARPPRRHSERGLHGKCCCTRWLGEEG